MLAHELSQHRPYHRDGETPKTGINVSATKTLGEIAADIKRRLLPELARLLADCRAAKQSSDDYEARRAANLRLVADACGVPVQRSHDGKVQKVELGNYGEAMDFEATPSCDGEVDLKIRVRAQDAAKIAALCRELAK
jgi:hypothetical protein